MSTDSLPAMTLAIDTSTAHSVVTVGRDRPAAVSRRAVSHRHGSHVLEQIEEVLAEADLELAEIGAIAVGTGPGSFTGLRVGLATAKTVAYVRSLPLIGIMSSDALRHAAVAVGSPAGAAIALPAGAHDHYLARAGEDPILVAPGGLAEALQGVPVVSIGMAPELLGRDASRWGEAALDGLPAALLALARERLERGAVDAVEELVPAYVALPRGVARAAEELGWSPDLR